MSAQTKIVVFHRNRVLLVGLALLLGIIIALSLFLSNYGKKANIEKTTPTMAYSPGDYITKLNLQGNEIDLVVNLSKDRINDIYFRDFTEELKEAYPLLEPTLLELKEQILEKQSTENLTYQDSNPYTAVVLIRAIRDAISKSNP